LIAYIDAVGFGIADAFRNRAGPPRLTQLSGTGWEMVHDDKQCTLCLFAQLQPPSDLNALPTTRSRDAGNRNAELY
jgi:hypothetical protein